MTFLVAMMGILLTWLLAGWTLCGIGLAAMPRRALTTRALTPAFWLGYVAVIGLLQIWHSFAAVSSLATLVLMIAGAMGWLRHRRRAMSLMVRVLPRSPGLGLLAILLALLFTANMSLGPARLVDTAGYHWNVVRWNAEHPIIPGLVNLHQRLAFNNASLLFPPLLELGPLHGRSNHVATGILLISLLVPSLTAIVRLARGRRADPWNVYLAGCLPALACIASLNIYLTSHNPDIHTMLVLLAGGLMLMPVMFSLHDSIGPVMRPWVIAAGAMCFSLAVTHKIGAVFFAGPASILILCWAWKQGHRTTAWVCLLLSCLLAASWATRSVILSGYPLYPSTILAMPVDWREPALAAWHNHMDIRHWAQWMGQPPQNGEAGAWWMHWPLRALSRCPQHTVLPGMLATAAILLLVIHHKHEMPGGRTWRAAGLACGVAGIAGCLATAPDPRFFAGPIWFLAVCLFTASVIRQPDGAVARRMALAIPITISALWLTLIALGSAQGLLYGPGPDAGFHPDPSPQLRVFTTDSGLKIYTPADPEQSLCDSPIPATPYPRADLMLRRPGELRSGFRHAKPEGASP